MVSGSGAYVVLLQTLPTVVGAVAELPRRVLGFGKFPLSAAVPVWSRGFHLLEVRVWVPLDMLFAVHH